MKITLVQCPCFTIRNPPLGLAHIACVLLREGHQLNIFDFNLDFYPQYPDFWKPGNEMRWLTADFFLSQAELDPWVEQFTNKILASDPDVIGFSVQSTSVHISMQVARRVKQKDRSKVIIFGGPECLREKAEFLLRDGSVDYLVQREGEQTLLELLKAFKQSSALQGCKGIIYVQAGAVVKNPLREPMDINVLPFPDFSLFERNRYLDPQSLPMMTSRGCVRRCKFCLDTWYQSTYCALAPEKVVEAIERLINLYAIKAVVFTDSLLNANLSHLEKMCDVIIKKKIDIHWHCNLMVRPMSDALLDKIYVAGCRGVVFGIESGSQRVLDLMNKSFIIGEASRLVRRLADRGIEVSANWLIGYPGEEREDFVKTAKFILKHREYFTYFSVSALAINAPSILSSEIARLKVRMNDDSVTWECGSNNLKERLHRRQALLNLIEKSAPLFEANKLKTLRSPLTRKLRFEFERKKVLNSFLKEFYQCK